MIAKRLCIATALVAVLSAPASAAAASVSTTHHHATFGVAPALTIHRSAPATFGIGTAITIHR